MKLYKSDWTPYPRRVAIYMLEKDIRDIELCSIDLARGEHKQAEYLKINPIGTVPALEVEPGVLIRESTAIIEYLEERYPEPNLIGHTALERARTRDMVSIINDACLYAFNHAVHVSRVTSTMVDQKAEVASAMNTRYRLSLDRMETMASGGAFLTGDRITYADCLFFAPFQYLDLFYAQKLPENYEKLNAVYDRMASRPSAAPPTYPAHMLELARQRV